MIAVVAGLLAANWPFRYEHVKPLLEKVFAGKVTMDRYRLTYFPHPGLVADGLTLRRNSAPDLPPVGSARHLVIQGRWVDLLFLRKRVGLVEVEGFHVVIPPVGSRANREDFPPGASADFSGPTTAVAKFRIKDAVLDLMKADGSRYTYPIHEAVIGDLQKGHAISYSLDMESGWPAGHILAHGSFGPLVAAQLGATPVSGEFNFSPTALSDIHGLRGTMSSSGTFHGSLMTIQADVKTDTPDFAVGSGRAVRVAATARITINGLNGDVHYDAIDASTGRTTVHAHGDTAGKPKVTNLDIDVERGRAEDLLTPFLHGGPPVAGAVRLHSHAYLAPTAPGTKFLQRLQMKGAFAIPSERFTSARSEEKLSEFSSRAQGNKTPEGEGVPEVLSSLVGDVTVRNGVASTHSLTFNMPGAGVRLNGTFSFQGGDAKLTGDLHMDSDISHATTGYKSWLLKPFAPLFKRGNAGAVIPIAVIGRAHKYKIVSDLLHRQALKKPKG